MRKREVKTWIASKRLNGEGRQIMTGTLLAMKTCWTKRYCLLLLDELENKGILQHRVDYVLDTMGRSHLTKCYWKR